MEKNKPLASMQQRAKTYLAKVLEDNSRYRKLASVYPAQKVESPVHPRQLHVLSKEISIDEYTSHKTLIENGLEKLAQLLEGCDKWVLSGGLSIPSSESKGIEIEPYRVHHAFHIGVTPNSFIDILSKASNHNYFAFRRWKNYHIPGESQNWLKPWRHWEKKFDFYKLLEPKEAEKWKLKNLRLIKVDDRGRIPSHEGNISDLDYVDIYLHHAESDKLISYDSGHIPIILPCPEYFNGEICITSSGKQINVVHLNFIKILKENIAKKRKENKKDLLDLVHINRYFAGKVSQ